MAKTQGPHHAPDEPRVQAIALVGQGYSHGAAAEIVGRPQTTVSGWVRRSLEAAKGNKPILDRHVRNAIQATDLIADGMDLIGEDDTRQLALKNLQTLNIIAGTATDKLQKESAPSQPGGVVINFVFKDEPIIEGEVVG